jgi:hypothetical protein
MRGAERTYKPGSVTTACRNRRSRATISLERRLPAASSSRPGSGDWTGRPVPASRPDSSLLGLAPSGVYRARPVTRPAGELLPHRFTLTAGKTRRRSAFCCTFPDLTAGGRYPPQRPVEPGLSSVGRPIHPSREQTNPNGGRPARSASRIDSSNLNDRMAKKRPLTPKTTPISGSPQKLVIRFLGGKAPTFSVIPRDTSRWAFAVAP